MSEGMRLAVSKMSLRDSLIKYCGIIKIAIRERMQYRFDFFMSLVAALMYAVLYYMLWRAIYHFTPHPVVPWTQLVTYVMVGQAINFGRYSPAERVPIYRMADLIRGGDVALELIKPVHFQTRRFLESFGFFVVETLWINLPLLGLAIAFLGVKAPVDWFTGAAFLISWFLGFMIAFALNLITIMMAFWTTNIHGAQLAKRALVEICSGVLIPFAFFPGWLQGIVTHLPFQGMAYIPISIYTGKVVGLAVWGSLAEQLGWTVLIFLIAQLIWQAAARQLTVCGG